MQRCGDSEIIIAPMDQAKRRDQSQIDEPNQRCGVGGGRCTAVVPPWNGRHGTGFPPPRRAGAASKPPPKRLRLCSPSSTARVCVCVGEVGKGVRACVRAHACECAVVRA